MQSSAVVTVRALVMLSCLVLVPLAAVFGSALPKVFNSLVEGHGVPRLSGHIDNSHDVRARGGDAPAFAAPPAPVNESSSSAGARDVTASLWAPALAQSASQPPAQLAGAAAPGATLAAVSHVNPVALAQTGAQIPLTGAAPDSGPTTDRFAALQARLRQLGMTYSLLETSGPAAQNYRFYCKVSVAGDSSHSRHFDATHADPLRAMQQVVEQVEHWRLSR